MAASGAFETAQKILRHLRKNQSLSAFQIPPNQGVIVGTYRVGSMGMLKVLSIPSVRPPEHWGRVLLSGLFRRRAKLLKGKRIVEVGAGSGWISIALAKLIKTRSVVSLDADPQAQIVTQINAILNGVQDRVRPQLTEPVDYIVGSIPQLLPKGLRRDSPALNGYGAGSSEDLQSLQFVAASLERSLPYLRRGGSIVLNVAGRAAFDVLRYMFAQWRFVGRLIHRERVQLDAMLSIEPLVRAERETRRHYHFYDMLTGTQPISATQAYQRMLQGDPVWHDLYVVEARSYRDACARAARRAFRDVKRIVAEPLLEPRVELARYLKGFCKFDVQPEQIQLASHPPGPSLDVSIYSRLDPAPRRLPKEGSIDLARHFAVPEFRMGAVLGDRQILPPSTLEQVALHELLKILNRRLAVSVETPPAQAEDVIALDEGESEWTAPRAAIRGARQGGTIREVQAAAARYLSKSRGLRVRPDDVVVGPGALALIDASLRALKTTSAMLPVPYSGGVRSLDQKFIPVLTRRVGDELSIELPDSPGVLLLAQPNNPTGLYYSESAIQHMARHVVLCDESAALLGDGYRPIKSKVVFGSLSKEFALSGLRVGFAATADASLRRAIRRELTHEPDPWSLGAAREVLSNWDVILKHHREDFVEPRRAMLERTLKELGIPYIPPRGGLWMWVDFDAVWLGRRWNGAHFKGKKVAKPVKISRENFAEVLRVGAWLRANSPEWSGVPQGPYRITYAVERLPEVVDRLRALALGIRK